MSSRHVKNNFGRKFQYSNWKKDPSEYKPAPDPEMEEIIKRSKMEKKKEIKESKRGAYGIIRHRNEQEYEKLNKERPDLKASENQRTKRGDTSIKARYKYLSNKMKDYKSDDDKTVHRYLQKRINRLGESINKMIIEKYQRKIRF